MLDDYVLDDVSDVFVNDVVVGYVDIGDVVVGDVDVDNVVVGDVFIGDIVGHDVVVGDVVLVMLLLLFLLLVTLLFMRLLLVSVFNRDFLLDMSCLSVSAAVNDDKINDVQTLVAPTQSHNNTHHFLFFFFCSDKNFIDQPCEPMLRCCAVRHCAQYFGY